VSRGRQERARAAEISSRASTAPNYHFYTIIIRYKEEISNNKAIEEGRVEVEDRKGENIHKLSACLAFTANASAANDIAMIKIKILFNIVCDSI